MLGALLILLPALALAAVMLVRPYAGERTIAALRARWSARREPRPRPEVCARRAPERVIRGGLLLAAALAGRAPPAPAAG